MRWNCTNPFQFMFCVSKQDHDLDVTYKSILEQRLHLQQIYLITDQDAYRSYKNDYNRLALYEQHIRVLKDFMLLAQHLVNMDPTDHKHRNAIFLAHTKLDRYRFLKNELWEDIRRSPSLVTQHVFSLSTL